MKLVKTLTAAVGMIAAAQLSLNAGTCTVNQGTTYQTIDGFGFSSAWCGTLSSAKNNAMYNTLGMSLLRIRIDQNNSWTDEQNNTTAAHSAGAKVLGCPWAIPSAYKSGTTIPTSQYGNYCNWLKSAAGTINFDYCSIKNEPDGSSSDGLLSGSQIEAICSGYAQNIGKPVAMADAVNFNDSWTDPTLNDSTAASHITYVSGHLYGGGLNVHQNALNHGKHVWMTEYYFDGNDIGTCMNIAKQISDCMNDQFSAYFWWWDNDSDTATLLVNSSGTIYKNGYTIGQFAKYVRPGKQRISTTYNPTSNVYVTAYHSGGLVIVAINTGSSSVSQTFALQNMSGVTTLNVNRTSSSQNMAAITAATVSNNSFTYTLPAQSITTFHQY